MALSGWGYSSTLRLATRVLDQSDLSFNCCFASTPNRKLDLPLEVKISKAWGLGVGGGGGWNSDARLQAPLLFAPSHFK